MRQWLMSKGIINHWVINIAIMVILTLGFTLRVVAYPVDLVEFSSPQGIKMLKNTDTSGDYWRLSPYFTTEKQVSYCGVATGVMVLNALGDKSQDFTPGSPYKLMTQDNIFTATVAKKLPADKVLFNGMSLDEFGEFLGDSGLNTRVVHAGTDGSTLAQFRQDAIAAISSDRDYIVVNIQREPIYGVVSGHISPLAAYDKPSDRFLLMDVARYRYPPMWIKAADLWRAMELKTRITQLARGYVIASKRES